MMIYRGLKISLLSLVLCISCIFICDASSQPDYEFYQLIFEACIHASSAAENAIEKYEVLAAENDLSAENDEEAHSPQDLGYPAGYDPDDPVAMGEVDPEAVYNAQQAEEMDRAMAEEAQRAWQEQYEPQPDISDHIIKP